MSGHDCPHCQRSFPRKKALIDHLARSHPDQAAPGDRIPVVVGALVALAVVLVLASILLGGAGAQDREALYHLSSSPHTGDLDAPVALIAFESPNCPSCRLFHIPQGGQESTFERIEARFIDTGQVVYAEKTQFINRPWERTAAHAQKCAWNERPSAFFNLTDAIYRDQPRLTSANLPSYLASIAREEGLDVEAFEACYQGAEHAGMIAQDLADAEVAGVVSTPTFIVHAPDGSSVRIVGAQDFGVFADAIERALSLGNPDPGPAGEPQANASSQANASTAEPRARVAAP